jgi:hypothetical protein
MITDNNFKTNLQEDGFVLLRSVLTEDAVSTRHSISRRVFH